MSAKDDLLRAAAQVLPAFVTRKELTVIVRCEEDRVSTTVRGPVPSVSEADSTGQEPDRIGQDADLSAQPWPAFSPLERSIVEAAPADGWIATKTIAQLIGESPEGDLPAILRNLVARGVLLSAQGKGFRLNARSRAG